VVEGPKHTAQLFVSPNRSPMMSRFSVSCVTLVMAFSASSLAQVATGTIAAGTVTDFGGLAVPAAYRGRHKQ
jgi:hypothetical protein